MLFSKWLPKERFFDCMNRSFVTEILWLIKKKFFIIVQIQVQGCLLPGFF